MNQYQFFDFMRFIRLKKITIYLLWFFATSISSGQNQELKNLQEEIELAKTDSLKINLLLDLYNHYYLKDRNLDSMVAISKRAIILSKKNKFLSKSSTSYGVLGIAYMLKGNREEAQKNIFKSYDYAKKVNNQKLIFSSLMRLSGFYEKTNDLPKSIEFALEGIKIAEETKDLSLKASVFYRLSTIYSMQDDEDKVKTYLDKATYILRQENAKVPASIKSGIYASTVEYFNRLSFKYPKNKKAKDSLLFYIDKGIIYGKSIKRASLIAHLLGQKGKVYFNDKNYSQAKKHYREALAYRNKIGKISLLNLYNKMAHINIEEGYIKTGLRYKDSILIDVEKETNYYRIAERYNIAYYICKAAKDYKKALEYHKLMFDNNNKAITSKQLKAVKELEIKYETEKKETQIISQKLENETLKNKARTNYFIISIVALLGFGIFAFLYYRKQNKVLLSELNLSKTKEVLHRSQINPHFISNSISAIYPFLYDKSDPNKAAAYLSDLSQMIRSILDATFDTSWTLKEEIEFIKQYCNIQRLTMDSPLNLEVLYDENLADIVIPSLITQTFVENCFVHGFTNKTKEAIIKLEIISDEFNLQIKISDNGFASKKTEKNHKSRSNEIVKQRILNYYSKKELSKDFLNCSSTNTGFEVQLKLPITK